jgi:hypothetical protein
MLGSVHQRSRGIQPGNPVSAYVGSWRTDMSGSFLYARRTAARGSSVQNLRRPRAGDWPCGVDGPQDMMEWSDQRYLERRSGKIYSSNMAHMAGCDQQTSRHNALDVISWILMKPNTILIPTLEMQNGIMLLMLLRSPSIRRSPDRQ